ncbi:MAG TPA: 1-(5-phosphoribosyl)-5-amino-4-imidazole-carboxylate carboxylase, partial [Nitrospiraceae bacterium]
MNPARLRQLLADVKKGTRSVEEVLDRLRTLPYEDLGFASLDHHRALRQGFAEVIFCEGKTDAQIRA